jgi:hypothetical protein
MLKPGAGAALHVVNTCTAAGVLASPHNWHIPSDMAAPPDKKAWQAAYRENSEALARIRTQELAAMTDEEALRRLQSLVTPDPV